MPAQTSQATFDAIVVGAGHNGLTAAAYLARAGKSVLVLERSDHVGGASVSAQVFPGIDARLSRYSYLVSLMPEAVRKELGLRITLSRRRFSSFTPDPVDPSRALLVDTHDPAATLESFASVGARGDAAAWAEFYSRTGALAARLFPTVTEPLMGPREVRQLIGANDWRDFVERPIGDVVERSFESDLVRGVVLTDSLIGTFARSDASDGLANRCFLYHVIGGGTGDWDVPVGGMGAVSGELERVAREAGARVLTRATVTAIDPGSPHSPATVVWEDDDGRVHEASASHVLAACAPAVLDRLLGREPEWPEGSQLKVNMLLKRLPRLRAAADPSAAFAGTFHINETASQLDAAFAEAQSGSIPSLPPAEIYCHTLTDRSILGPQLNEAGVHTLTLFALHQPASLFRADPEASRAAALETTLASLDSVLDEPIRECLATTPDGEPCIEARSPVDLEEELAMPGGHIFHGDLSWPWAEREEDAGTWGVETAFPRVFIAGAGARRGGGVSAIAGRDAAMAVLSK
ncbi:phytoene desaturase family protein [Demequina sp.]|uniref:phytoene desaturase family protein n=1 Tax=Demequina sp. TaxID=2050685 RepID=UPI003D096634